ncbi:response regulator [Pedobacter endophyticus]|uniref:histidine kinase n=1 Tax=Pedobacter endophyticus TaxID=2789740 RepID=A0A7U3Q3H0_9SPHI|nr:response regulator [Pedobacter endophyticus]QPH37854.1 response regulator [Pedobacter endophyticus]
MNLLISLSVILLIFYPKTSQGHNFKVIDISNGLSNNTVKCIAQDKFGFMWFGTYDGLCRYDGINFTIYRYQKNINSINSNSITAILPTDEGLWVGTTSGLNFFSFNEKKFYKGLSSRSNKQKKSIDGTVRNIIQVGKKIIVLADKEGLLVLEKDRSFKPLSFGLRDAQWHMIAPYKEGNFLAHSTQGLFILNPFKEVLRNKLIYSLPHPVHHIYYSKKQGKIFVGSGIGKSSMVFQEKPNGIVMLNDKIPSGIKCAIDFNRSMIFGTDGQGLIFSGPDKTEHFIPKNSNISSDAIYSLFVDKGNNLWIGTFRGGINVFSERNNWFTSFSTQNSYLKHNFVTSIYESPALLLYTGTDGGGINIFNRKTQKSSNYTSANSNISGNNVVSISGDGNDVWLGVYGKGLSYFSNSTHSFTNYELPQIPDVREKNSIWVVKDDRKGNLWIGSEDGLFTFNKRNRKFVLIKPEILKITEISFAKEAVWLSTNGNGLYQLDYGGNIVKRYLSEENKAFANNNLHYVFVDSKQNIWFGAEHVGLYQFTPSSGKFVLYGPEQGFENPNVLGITEDHNNNLWISSYNGLFLFNTSKHTFLRFGEKDQIASSQFNYNACYQNNGVMYFGTAKGLVSFKPTNINFDPKFKSVIFTGFKLLNQNNDRLKSLNSPAQVIQLPYDHNFFSISFTVPELISPDKIKYSFYLENFENTWTAGGSERQVTYTNVPPGTYYFKVKSTNLVGEWNKNYSELKITILPPWWRTNWATTIFVILSIGVITTLLYFYRYQLNIKHLVQLKELEKSTEKSINEAKLTFFTNISHELRTPIFMLTAPLEDLLKNKGKLIQVPRAHLIAMFKNALRLNKLITRIIDFRKLEVGKLDLEAQTSNVVAFCKELIPGYETLCHQKKIVLLFMPSSLNIQLSFDAEKLETILANLISNAFKYSHEQGRITFSINEENDTVVFSVEDNGIGVKEEYHEKIFDRFFQVDRNVISGDGIGLAFVKHLVELHQGKISVTSRLNEGAKFTFSIPKHLELSNNPAPSQSEQLHVLNNGAQNSTLEYPTNPSALHTVLLIDDEPDILSLIEQLLKDEYKIIKANNGAEGLEKVEEFTPDIIICDMMMPKMNGMDFISALKTNKLYAAIPVIILTAKSGEEDMIAAYGFGADAYLTKPVSVKYLKQRVSQILSKSNSVDISQILVGKKTNYSKMEKDFMMKCNKIIEQNLTNTAFNVLAFSKELGMSHSSFYKKLKAMTGKSIIEFMNAYRIYKSVQMFNEGEKNISTVSTKCGFKDPKNFREAFKQVMRVAPKNYINS